MITVDNLQTLCHACHQAKEQRTVDYRASVSPEAPSPRALVVRRELLRGLMTLILVSAALGIACMRSPVGHAAVLDLTKGPGVDLCDGR